MGSWFFFSSDETDITDEPIPNNLDTNTVDTEPEPLDVKPKSMSRSRMDLIGPPPETVPANGNEKEYSASAASSGSGYFGNTAILGKTLNEQSELPPDAMEIMIEIETYLNDITLNEEIMSKLPIPDQSYLDNVWNDKLENTLNELIENKIMSGYAFNALQQTLNALKAKEYDKAKKQITQITKKLKEFKVNKKWIIPFKSIIKIAKQNNI